jgi:uncharacterized protein (DUF2236 family)
VTAKSVGVSGIHWRRGRAALGETPWVPAIAAGADDGYFGPGSAVWAVHSRLPTMIGGIRALLIQALHPGALAGVHDHSRYRTDAMSRLEATTRWVATTTFGDRALAEAAARGVRRIHRPVHGTYTDGAGEQHPYSAQDPELLRWVHDAFTEAFLGAHLRWGGSIPGGPDRYIAEWAASARLLGVADPVTTQRALREELDRFLAEASPDERVRDTVEYLRHPPVSRGVRVLYPVLFGAAVASLSPRIRSLLDVRRPWWPAITTARIMLAVGGLVLGRTSPSARAAAARAERLRAAARTDGIGS